ncbi:MAG: AAA family ATPase [Gammaproteobacteria bacterium]|nr:AAA family ATPase [Gammaproteobacteria bacterium]
MYITTFYSFKGGVGRSMALVNAGVELARRGRRVLLIDFDLEAPGIDTFNSLNLEKPTLGLVDFVNSYLTTGISDEFEKYVVECKPDFPDKDAGNIWLMPAGGKEHSFANLSQSIDWWDLYTKRDGFLLMEDLKQQWKDKLNPDYVLIDSRTGHTDVGGICTRQLPDAVTIFYFPNEQNLRGLRKLVKDIRSEKDAPRNKEIQLHFVMSNVPDLDDEHQILEKEISKFKLQLELEREPLIVHRYDSLSLLNQAIFTLSRPNSRLAKEYCNIVDQVVNVNLEDRDGALNFLNKLKLDMQHNPPWETESWTPNNKKSLDKIEAAHNKDPEILYQLGRFYFRERELERSISLYQNAIDMRTSNPNVYLDQARALSELGDKEKASQVAFQVLDLKNPSFRLLVGALRLIQSETFIQVPKCKSVISLNIEQRVQLITELYFSERGTIRSLANLLVQPLISDEIISISDKHLQQELGLLYISIGKFQLAKRLFDDLAPATLEITTTFNLAMAAWGESRNHTKLDFENVIKIHEANQEDEDRHDSANYLQCIGLAYWAMGDGTKALEYAEKSLQFLVGYRPTFSCWRYLYVNHHEFKTDINEFKRLVEGDETMQPVFLKNTSNQLPFQ